MITFLPSHKKYLTINQTKDTLHDTSFIKEKLNEALKGRVCADDRKQRGLFSKEETASPIVRVDYFMVTATIEVSEVNDTDMECLSMHRKNISLS